MSTSENGWAASPDRAAIEICALSVNDAAFPGGVRGGDVAKLLGHVARQFHDRVEPLDARGCWGYYYRPIRGSQIISNHASGTALDFNAPQHPQGKRGTFSAEQVAEIRKILDETGGAVVWGGDWDDNSVDEMHFEIGGDAATVARAASAVKTSAGSSSTPQRPTLHQGSRGQDVSYLQDLLNRMFPAYSHLAVDGIYGPATAAVVREFQQRSHLDVDGVTGPRTWSALLGG